MVSDYYVLAQEKAPESLTIGLGRGLSQLGLEMAERMFIAKL